tara:strand:- start:541 stop:960 length:420 start_codon:yes stop_codon:yes gene_type:complete
MAQLNNSLSLKGTSTDLGSTLALTVSDVLSIGAPQRNVSKEKVPGHGGSSTHLNLLTTADSSTVMYVYLKHSGFQSDGTTASTDNLIIKNGDNICIAQLAPLEFMFIPFLDNAKVQTLDAFSSHTSQGITVEYAYFTKV